MEEFPNTAIDANRQGLIGAAIDRVDGLAKATGSARYALDYASAGKVLHGVIVSATIAKGRIVNIDATNVNCKAGVRLVLTHQNVLAQRSPARNGGSIKPDASDANVRPALFDARIRYHGAPVALVVAETFEQAREGAMELAICYEEEPAQSELASNLHRAFTPVHINGGRQPDSIIGDFDAAFSTAEAAVEATFTTPWQNHNPMEPWATLAIWRGGKLTLYTSTQSAIDIQESVADTLRLPKSQVRVICGHVGGGFGGKLLAESDVILAAHAARYLGRPVMVAMTRQQSFFLTAHRPETIQRVRLGASRNGTLMATGMDVIEQTTQHWEYAEHTAAFTRRLYAAPARRSTHRIIALDVPAPDTMRAPGEGIGMLSYEVAMDELAEKLHVDPIELRSINEPGRDPESGLPFGSRRLVECLREGAARFDWRRRPSAPRTIRDGEWWIGFGLSACTRGNSLAASEARVTLDNNRRLLVQTSMTDIGTGTRTILAQIAAEATGLPLSQVDVELGDSSLPVSPGSSGSLGAASVGSAVLDACNKLNVLLHSPASEAPPGTQPLTRLGRTAKGSKVSVNRSGADSLSAIGAIAPGLEQRGHVSAGYGAMFAEVAVSAITGETRVRRLLGVFTVGRVLNAKTTRSQLIGGMIWGLSAALHEETIVDHRWALPLNHDLAQYHVPVHADIAHIEALVLPELERHQNALKVKGVGEIGICGSGAAVANAIYNACGVRIRDYPITLDKLISAPAFFA